MLFVYVLQGSKGAHSSCFGSSKRFQGAGSYTNPTSSPGKRVLLQYRDNIRAHAPCSLYITPSLFPSVYPPFVLPSTFGLLSLSPPPPNPLSLLSLTPPPHPGPGAYASRECHRRSAPQAAFASPKMRPPGWSNRPRSALNSSSSIYKLNASSSTPNVSYKR